jgi:hypothetical protein
MLAPLFPVGAVGADVTIGEIVIRVTRVHYCRRSPVVASEADRPRIGEMGDGDGSGRVLTLVLVRSQHARDGDVAAISEPSAACC